MPHGSTPLPLLGVIARASPRDRRGSYLLAAAAGAVAVIVTSRVPALAERSTFLLALAVIIFAAWRWGWKAGAGAAVTSFAAIAWLIPPANGWFSREGNDVLRYLTFAGLTLAALLFARARERAEARLRRAEALAGVVVENGPVLIAGADSKGNTAIFNRACEQLTGYSRDEVMGRPFIQTFVPESWQGTVIARLRDAPLEELAQPHANPWLTKARRERMIEWRCFRVLQDDGEPIIVGVGQDVTEREQAQAMITESLARETAAREALASANTRKEQFIALLAHELRTPLNAAMGWFHILRTGKPEGAADRAAETVERNLQMMHALIEDVVDFNRAEFGKLTLNRKPVDPAALVTDVVTSARSIADARQIALHAEIEPDLPEIAVDSKRLRQVVLNVVSNALKFTQPGGEVRVSARAGDGGLTIGVADNGPGIAPDHLQKIFDPLWQPGGGERSDGLGLGLALVKRLVDAHGGTVHITSDGPGHGTRVLVSLPAQGMLDTEVAV